MNEKANILLVDDKDSRLLTYEVILERLQQNLVRAHSGEEALEKLAEMEYAAILLDINMPGLNGFETAAHMRENPVFARTPIIFVTGVHITDLDRLRGYEMGAADYVYVPVVPEILRGKVQVLVQLFQQRRELARLNDRLASANSDLAAAHARLKAENTRELQKLNRTLEAANVQLISEVAERKRAESLLRETARRKDEFISILAHELRNPIAAMQSGIELLGTGALPEAKLPWIHDLLRRQQKHLTRLIDDLLDVSRVTNGRVTLKRETLDLRTMVEHSLDAVRPLIDAKGHTLCVNVPDEALALHGDPVRLTQVLGNLLTNAARYTPDGGSVTLSLDEDTEPDWIRISVRDDGDGIAEDMLERIFELFTQAHGRDARTHAGLGIGLALVRGLVELHGGSVHAVSEGPGRGSEFVVRLPLRQAPPGHSLQPGADPSAAAVDCALRLLVIDDNEDLANGLAMYLSERSGHEVRVAHTGLGGLDAARHFEPDAVLLDIGLPDIDGYEVARRLRADSERHVPLIAISGFSSDEDRRRAEQAGFDRYFVKPVAYDALNDALAEQARLLSGGDAGAGAGPCGIARAAPITS